MKNVFGTLIVALVLSLPLNAQRKNALPFFVAYADGKAYLLIADMPRNARGFTVHRSSGGDFALLTAEPVLPIQDALLLHDMLGKEYEDLRKALKATSEVQLLRRLQSDPGTSFAFSLVSPGIARACGRLFIDEKVEEGESYTYRVAIIDFNGKTMVTHERTVEMESEISSAPEDLTVEAGDGKVKISWRFMEYSGDPDDITVGFNIYRDDRARRVKINPLPVLRQEGGLSRIDRNVSNGQEYRYTVTAVDFLGRESEPSAAATALPKDHTPPAVPTGLAAVPSEGTITLHWKHSIDADLSHYDVYRGDSSQGQFRKINGTPVSKGRTVLVDSGLTFGDYYFYRVKAIDSSGNESAMSASIPARPKDTKSPPSPASLTAEATESLVLLRWEPPNDHDVAGYYVYRGFTRENLLRVVSSPLAKDTLEYRDPGFQRKGLWQGKNYYYAISAIDRAQNESPKNILAVAIPDHEPPRPPGDVSIHTTTQGQIEVRWQPSLSLDVRSYRIYRSETQEDAGVIADTAGFSFLDGRVIKGETYSYQLAAVDSSGNESEKTAAVAIIPRSTHLAPPVTIDRIEVSSSGASVFWEPVTDTELAGYKVYRSDHAGGEYRLLSSGIISATTFHDPAGTVGIYYKVTTVTHSGRENRGARPVRAGKVEQE